MSDTLPSAFLLAAAPIGGDWSDGSHLPLAVLPCLRGLDLTARTPYAEEE